MNRAEARRQFAATLNFKDDSLELDRAALLIAAEEYPQLDVEAYLRQLDRLAEEARRRLADEGDAFRRLLTLANFLFQDCGFGGNAADYYDARNSFLNDVIDRRKGIPITLSVLLMEVARRLGLTVFGVGMPGHFIVKFFDASQEEVSEIFLDPFNGGRLLSEDDCRRMIAEMSGGTLGFNRSLLAVSSKTQILARMLQNLKGIYTRAADHHKTLAVIERLLLISPGAPGEVRDRGLACAALGRHAQARADLEAYLSAMPHAEDANRIRETLTRVRQRQAQLN
jgi:regulator of sirC expression with transglutaminase-like and TPR domain